MLLHKKHCAEVTRKSRNFIQILNAGVFWIIMGLIELASSNSFWRGVDYYKSNKVISWKKNDEDTYSGTVKGSNGRILYGIYFKTI
jgi:hypothetical protein